MNIVLQKCPLVLAVVLPVLLWAGCSSNETSPEAISVELAQLDQAFQQQQFGQVLKLADALDSSHPDWIQSRLIAGQAAMRLRQQTRGLEYFESVPRNASPHSVSAAYLAGEIYYERGRLAEAAEVCRYVIQQDPHHLPAHARLAFLYALCGERWRADQHFFMLVKTREADFKYLVLFTDFNRSPDQTDFLQSCNRLAPDDVLVDTGLIVDAASRTDSAELIQQLEDVVRRAPELGSAQALLGEFLLQEDLPKFADWYAQLPQSLHAHPGIWFVRGLRARQLGELTTAAGCFRESVQLTPTDYRANAELGQVLSEIHPEASRAFHDRAANLRSVSEALSQVLASGGGDEAATEALVSRLMDMGRHWEAWSWASMAVTRFPRADWTRPVLSRLSGFPNPAAPRFRGDTLLTDVYDLSGLEIQDELFAGEIPSDSGRVTSLPDDSAIRFDDQASQLGIEFVYHQSPDPTTDGVRIFESTGGGVAVLDLDHDGRPDLYLTQGEDWSPGSDVPDPSAEYADRLYRNRGDRFEDVTEAAGRQHEDGYSQGCSAGDFNNDGFVDLYVANIGRNCLLLNNGDGTFQDVSETAGLSGSNWTSSCLIADLNQDSAPDLFDVNYLQGEDIYRVVCNESRCSPTAYDGAADVVQISDGQGGVAAMPDATPVDRAKGLGIIAYPAGPHGRLNLFIANDQVPNFLLQNQAADDRWGLTLQDIAFSSGVAVNGEGNPTACMGVAAEDLNGDDLIELFVTNFKGEANTLYLQDSEGLFRDATGSVGLRNAGLPYVGWGTQFLDADNNGELDLVVTNGHVADFQEPGVQYAMPTQFFRNRGGLQFQEEPPQQVGASFFSRNLFGRGLARLDWNQDGRQDAVLSVIGSGAAVLTNSSDSGSFLTVQLHAVESARDAIGATVAVHTNDGVIRRQLLAGDGYQATNERVLHFGLGDRQQIHSVQVTWPSGSVSVIEDVPLNVRLQLVEGHPSSTIWQNGRPAAF